MSTIIIFRSGGPLGLSIIGGSDHSCIPFGTGEQVSIIVVLIIIVIVIVIILFGKLEQVCLCSCFLRCHHCHRIIAYAVTGEHASLDILCYVSVNIINVPALYSSV